MDDMKTAENEVKALKINKREQIGYAVQDFTGKMF